LLCAACLLASVAQAGGFEARVRAVVDGDTLSLESGQSVRLIGINTPEKARGRKPGEPLADAATRALEQLIGHSTVRVTPGPEKSDRHGRLLAWVEVGGRDAGYELVRDGLAAVVAFPPNIGRLDSYLAAERTARTAGRGIWKDRYFAPRDARDPEAIREGFGFYRGTVSGSGESKKYVYLDLGPELSIRVTRTNWNRFFRVPHKDWIGRAIVVRGWVNSDWKLEVRHPSMIEQQ
jgi:endonuclease YncB( thermonuclease family)